MATFPLEKIKCLRKELSSHPVYGAVSSMDDLTLFMQHHVYSVWDFMSLLKYLQNEFAPTGSPWLPQGDPQVRRFINDIVLEEESDEGLPLADGTPTYASHFELYIAAMEEVRSGCSREAETFVAKVASGSLQNALNNGQIPEPSRTFMRTTFAFIDSDKPHVVAAAFALGREHIIPEMFRALLATMNITKEQAEVFHYYLERHIHLDSDFHGPMSLRMLELLCGDDETKIVEAEEAAISAIEERIRFWDGVLKAITDSRSS
ncbi:MAG: DUF3050 domain-containing protein [Helicobacteraceae bacterium]|jgi:hypothetical protein|nr:DUF3050 domain-containing protein [Helicobacteraceae bacterium]